MLQYQTIYPATLTLLKELQSLEFLTECRLVGGTALALQLGHRRSVDLDLFGIIPVIPGEMIDILRETHSVSTIKESKNIHIYLIDGIKVDIVNFKYDWIDDMVAEGGLKLAGVKDIAAMKVAAIIGRGTKKDFIDMYYLLEHFSLKEILDLYLEKYPDGSLFLALKSLSYFTDAESDPMPFMFDPILWQSVKKTICNAIAHLG